MRKGEKPRGVGDYLEPNKTMKRSHSPVLRAEMVLDRNGGSKVFSTIDFKAGFHQLKMEASAVAESDFNTRHGEFDYLVMPMGA